MKQIGWGLFKTILICGLSLSPGIVLANSMEVTPIGTIVDAETARTALQGAVTSMQAIKAKAAATATSTATTNPVMSKRETAKVTTANSLEASFASCQSAAQYARICLAEVSEHIQTGVGVIGTLLSTIKNTKDMSSADACKKQKSATATAQKALTLYNAACALAQAHCASSCEGLSAKLTASKAAFDPQDGFEKVTLNVEPQKKLCHGYKWNMAAAGMGLFSMLAESGKMTQCEDKTAVVDCKVDPYNAACALKMDCSKQENYQQTQCICQRSPNSQGCAGYAGGNINMPAGSTNTPTGTSVDNGGNINLGTSDSIPVAAVSSGSGTGASSLGGAGGSGAAGGANGFGVGGAAAKTGGADAAKKDKGLNPNILGGMDGGGGGGGSSGSSRSTASDSDSPYKNYLPGAKNDPTASAKIFGGGQVTGSGSKSNWEKVRDRYSEAKSSLVGP